METFVTFVYAAALGLVALIEIVLISLGLWFLIKKLVRLVQATPIAQDIKKVRDEKRTEKERAQKEAYYATEPDQIEWKDPRFKLASEIFKAAQWPSENSVRAIYDAVKAFKEKGFKFHEKLSIIWGDYVDGWIYNEDFYGFSPWELTLKAFYEELLTGKSFSQKELEAIQRKLTLQLRLQEAYKNDDLTAFKAALDEGADPEYKYYSYGMYEVLNEGWEKDTLCQRYLLTLDTKNAREYREAKAKEAKERKIVEKAEAAVAA